MNNNIFKQLIENTQNEYNKNYVYVGPNMVQKQTPKFIEKNVFDIPESIKDEYKKIIKLNKLPKKIN